MDGAGGGEDLGLEGGGVGGAEDEEAGFEVRLGHGGGAAEEVEGGEEEAGEED